MDVFLQEHARPYSIAVCILLLWVLPMLSGRLSVMRSKMW